MTSEQERFRWADEVHFWFARSRPLTWSVVRPDGASHADFDTHSTGFHVR